MKDSRYKEIMKGLGMPDSKSLLFALEQVANEVGQEKQKDIDFLLNRSEKAGSCSFTADRDTGMSSNALVTFAYTGKYPTSFPWDNDDYQACKRAFISLPCHRRTKVVSDMLEHMKTRLTTDL